MENKIQAQPQLKAVIDRINSAVAQNQDHALTIQTRVKYMDDMQRLFDATP